MTTMHRTTSARGNWFPFMSKSPDRVPECCKRRAKQATSTKTTRSHFSLYDGISYRFVDGSMSKKFSSTVGGQRVPFLLGQVKHLRLKREYLECLSPIEEEISAICESCHSMAFSNLSKTKCITLTTIKTKRIKESAVCNLVTMKDNKQLKTVVTCA